MRKYLRSIAYNNMKKAGIEKINKRPWVTDSKGIPYRDDSKFAKNWRDYC